MDLPDLPEPPPDENEPSTSTDRGAQTSESFYKQLQVLTTFVTLVVAVTAIALSVWEGYETRLSNRLAVQPYLEGSSRLLTEDSTYSYTVYVNSDGLGPAVYEKILVYGPQADSTAQPAVTSTKGDPLINLYDAPELRSRWEETDIPQSGFFSYFRQGTMQRPGDKETFFQYGVEKSELDPEVEGQPHMMLRELLNAYSVVICYCSVYGDRCGQTHVLGSPPSTEICADLGYEE